MNGETFLFKPRPAMPPVYIGGAAPYALRRAARYGDGWASPSGGAEELRAPIAELKKLFRDARKAEPELLVPVNTAFADIAGLKDKISAFAEIGATRIAIVARYEDVDAFRRLAEAISRLAEDI